jgi:amino acid adenylation domain-containing protein
MVTVYSADLFDGATVERMMAQFLALVEDAVKTPERRLSQLALVTEAERRQLAAWNATEVVYPRDVCLHELIEDQAAKTPSAVAVTFENEALTYNELNARANQLARALAEMGVRQDATVGVCLERSIDLVVSLLAILKAGGAYVPLDPSYPRERLLTMLADARPPVLLTEERLGDELSAAETRIVCVDRVRGAVRAHSTENLGRRTSPNALAYVIFTSGSTGRPKGAMNAHAGICNRLFWMQQEYRLTGDDCVLQKTPFSFDVSVWEFFWPLMVGAHLVVARPGGHQDPAYLADVIVRERVTTLHFVPSMLQVFLAERSVTQCTSLVRVICSGEALSHELQQRFHAAFEADLHNLYGPTEAAVDVTCWACEREGDRAIVPIGRPVANARLYVLDRSMQPVPIGVAGELHLGGIQVGRGYVRRPDLTADRFIPDPFSPESGARMYRTGDLARFLGDGAVEYLGRLDDQVKIRGVRIELGDIEATLAQHPAVRDNVVVARPDAAGDKRLVAYLVPNAIDAGGAARGELDAEHVAQWQMLYDDTYAASAPLEDPTFNIVSWNSSYTGLPIPGQEMREWVDQTVDRILARAPKRVLEIGCGTGLLLWRVAPSCDRYTATDFSKTVIRGLEAQLAGGVRRLPQVELRHCAAHEFDGIEPAAYDAVVLNSVVQYFPGIDYLVGVLKSAITAVAPSGFILIGDVRSLPLLEAYHTSVQLHRAPDPTPVGELQQRVRRQVVQEEELVIDPGFFAALARQAPAISRVIVRLKRGVHHNELTRFRYDVLLEIGGDASAEVNGTALDWRRHALSVERIRRTLVDIAPERFAISGVPNARHQIEARAVRWVLGTPRHQTVADLRTALAGPIDVEDPETLVALGEELGYAVDVTWTPGAHDGSFDVVFRRPSAPEAAIEIGARGDGTIVPSWRAYANNPLHGTMSRKLVPQIRAFVEQKLPTYLMPSAFVLLDGLPLSPNGKVDRRALPEPEHLRAELRETFEAPRTPTEQVIAGIFSEILGVDRVGVNDSFFQLGGHSLLATQVVSRVFEYLQVTVEVRSVFEQPTPAGLAASILADAATRPRIERIAEMLISLSDVADDDLDSLAADKRMLTEEAI